MLNNRSAKRLLFGLVMTLFSLMLVFAALMFLLLDVAGTVIKASSPVGQETGIVVWIAIGVGVVGLAVAWVGVARNN